MTNDMRTWAGHRTHACRRGRTKEFGQRRDDALVGDEEVVGARQDALRLVRLVLGAQL